MVGAPVELRQWVVQHISEFESHPLYVSQTLELSPPMLLYKQKNLVYAKM